MKINHKSPPKLEVRESCPINNIDLFIRSLLSTIVCIMKTEVDDNKMLQIEREIMIYLTNLFNFEVGMDTEKKQRVKLKVKFGLRNIISCRH